MWRYSALEARGRRVAASLERFYKGALEGPPTTEPPACPEDTRPHEQGRLRFAVSQVSESRLGVPGV